MTNRSSPAQQSLCQLERPSVIRRRYFCVVFRGPDLGRHPISGRFGGILYFPFDTAQPFDRSGPDWGRLSDSVHSYFLHEPRVRAAQEILEDYQEFGEEERAVRLVFGENVLSLPLRPITPCAIEVPTPLGKRCCYPTDEVPFDPYLVEDSPILVYPEVDE
jgi:hypothetical protein